MAHQAARVLFTSQASVAIAIEGLLRKATASVDAALYRLTNPQLTKALERAHRRSLRVRVLTDQGKYEETQVTRDLLADTSISFRTLNGCQGRGSNLQHRFAILDGTVVLAGSYNWTLESEEGNYDHLLVLPDPELALTYQQEFDRLWAFAQKTGSA
jgi:mitochondrial cardiolipin hydrolase